MNDQQNLFSINSPAITLREALDTLFLYKWVIVSVFIGVVASAGILVFFLLSPQYSASSIIIFNPSNLATPVSQALPQSDFEKTTTFHSQKDIIKSATVAAPVVTQLGLAQRRVLSRIETIKNSMLNIRRKIGHLIGNKKWQKEIDPAAASIDAILKHLDIVTTPESNTMKLSYRAGNPDEAAQTLNAVIDTYNSYFNSLIKLRTEGVIDYLQTQLDSIQWVVAKNEAALLHFKQNDRIPISSIRNASTATSGLTTPALMGLTDNNVMQNEIKAHIFSLEDELRRLKSQYNEQDSRLVDIRTKLNDYVKLLNQIPDKEIRYMRLRREWELNQEIYILMKKNLITARTVEAGNTSKINIITIVERAAPDDKPVSPKKKQILLLSLFFGGAMGIVIALICNFLDHKIKSPRDIELFTNLKVLGSLKKL